MRVLPGYYTYHKVEFLCLVVEVKRPEYEEWQKFCHSLTDKGIAVFGGIQLGDDMFHCLYYFPVMESSVDRDLSDEEIGRLKDLLEVITLKADQMPPLPEEKDGE